MTKTKGQSKNAAILTTISGLAGFGVVKLVEYLGQATAAGAYEPTAAFFQGIIGLLVAGGLALAYSRTGVTSLPLDDKTIQDIVEELGTAANEYQDEKTE